jgi:hypothetical protein
MAGWERSPEACRGGGAGGSYCPVKVDSVLSCKSPQDLCRHQRITVAPKFTGQIGFCPFCGFFSARLRLENHHRDVNGRNFCLNLFFSTSTCTFQSSSVPGEYFVLVQKMCYFPELSAISCHPSIETIPKHWHHIHLYPNAPTPTQQHTQNTSL